MLSVARVDKIIYGFSILLSRWINRGKQAAARDYQRILVIRLDEIGDLCYSGPVLEALRQRYPAAEITLWCQPFAKALFAANPSLNQLVTRREDLSGQYDLHVDLRGKWQGLFYSLFHSPAYRLERGIVRLRHKRAGRHPHALQTNFEVISPILPANTTIPAPRLYPSTKDEQSALEFMQKNQLTRFAVLHPGARRELRRWPAERFAQIAAILHRELSMQIVFIGDPSEKELVNSIQKQIPFPTFSTTGVLSLGAFAALMPKASLFIGNESGPLHIAALSGTPSLGLYGPGEPNVFYPITPRTAVLHKILECNPCDQVHCKYPGNPCIARISTEEVLEKVTSLLNEQNS
jgi:ADP-heptose:LPS heptosyltransferase